MNRATTRPPARTTVLYMSDTLIELAGSERNLFEIVTRLDPESYDVIVACMRAGNMVDVLRDRKIEVYDLNLRKIYSLAALRRALALRRFIRERGIGMVVTYHESSDFWGGVVARLSGVPVVISSRRDMGYTLGRRHRLVYRFVNRLFDRIITVSEAVASDVATKEKVLWHKLVTIYNGVDIEKYAPRTPDGELRRSLGLPEGVPVIGMPAVLRPIKGHRYFIEAAAKVVRRYPEARFVIAGWFTVQPYAREMVALARRLGLEKNVLFLGGKADMAPLYSLMDMAVFASDNEGFSNAVVEAMASGKPVVATDSGGTAEALLHGETGLLVPPRDSRALADAMLQLLDDRERAAKMGAKGRLRAVEHFSMPAMMKAVTELYETLLDEKDSGGVPLRRFTLRGLKWTARSFLKEAAGGLIYYTGLLRLLQKARVKADGLRILAYHRVSDRRFLLPGMGVKVGHFEKQMRYIKKHFRVLSLEEAAGMLQRGERPPANALVVTFDDGYRDNYVHAYPVLKRYGIPATIFLSVKAIDEQGMLWFDMLTEAFRMTRAPELELPGPVDGRFSLATVEERILAANRAVESAKKLPGPERARFIGRLLERLAVRPEEIRSRKLMMRWEEVIAMKKDGISFGNHGMNHSILSRLTQEELHYEIGKAKEIIRQRTGIDTLLFAYPNGNPPDFNGLVEDVVRQYGHVSACTLVKGLNDLSSDQLMLRRVCVTEGMESNVFGAFSEPLFAVALSGILHR